MSSDLIKLNRAGEVADLLDVDQFQPGKSAYECVAFSAALTKYAGPPGHGVTGTPADVVSLAEKWYSLETGNDTNSDGMSVPQLENMLRGTGQQFTPLAADVYAVRAALEKGYPVLICGAEDSFYDTVLGRVPYNWPPSGNHCIVASGISPSGDILVHDCASIAPSGVRPGPRIYDAQRMSLVSATAIIPPWLASGGQPAPAASGIPGGWKDDGTTLTAPNNVPVVLGFRAHILSNHWNAANWPMSAEFHASPLEYSNLSLGEGQKQCFKWTTLEWTPADNRVFEAWQGQEIYALLQKLNSQAGASSAASAS